MNSKITDSQGNTVSLEITVEKKIFDDAMDRSYKKNVKSILIPGFRKGKAPRRFIEKYYGESIFYEDAINFACPDAYDKAVEEHSLEPVDRPDIDIVSIGEGDFVFSAKITVKPEFELAEYKGVKLDKIDYKVTQKDINEQIEKMREQNARLVSVEDRAIKKGDTAVIDFEGFIGDEAFEGGKGENHNLEIGSGQFIPGFEEQLVGKKAGKELSVTVTFPEDYHAEDLKGKEAVFKVKIHSIMAKELPEKDDEFAKDVSEFDTLEELTADIKSKLEQDAKTRTLREKENKVLEAISEKTQIDIPECMIEAEIERMIQDFGYKLSQQGMSLEQYAQYTGITFDGMHDQFKERAADKVKGTLILEKISKLENIEVTDEDKDAELAKMAEMYGMEIDKVKDIMKNSMENMTDEIKINKTLAFLVESSVTKRATRKKGVSEDESGTGSSGANE